MKRLIIVISFIGLLSGCISFNIGPSQSRKAKDVEYKEPNKPFKSFKASNADRAWISEKTGNTLSYSSECGDNSPNIDQVYTELISGVSKSKVIEENRGFFNERTSISATTQGNLDGIPVQMSFLVFKKNSCVYSISYGGVEQKFNSELNTLKAFLDSFKAP